MNEKTNCPDCGTGIGEPHKHECDIELCSACGGQRICCDCDGHDPVVSAWTGEWPESDEPTEHVFEETGAEEFVADEVDLRQLADAYLQEAMALLCFSFFTGHDEERRALFLMNRFERVASHLTVNQRWAIIEEVDRQRSATTGDTWHVFKYACRSDFWRTPADFDAVVRVAEAVPEEMTPDQEEQYGLNFLETLREVRRMNRSTTVPDWKSDGF